MSECERESERERARARVCARERDRKCACVFSASQTFSRCVFVCMRACMRERYMGGYMM